MLTPVTHLLLCLNRRGGRGQNSWIFQVINRVKNNQKKRLVLMQFFKTAVFEIYRDCRIFGKINPFFPAKAINAVPDIFKVCINICFLYRCALNLYSTDHQQPVLPRFFFWCTVNTRSDLTFRMIYRQTP